MRKYIQPALKSLYEAVRALLGAWITVKWQGAAWPPPAGKDCIMEFRCLQDFSKLVSCSDVAAEYMTSRATVYLYCKKGKIKGCVKTRHGYLIDPTAVEGIWEKREK